MMQRSHIRSRDCNINDRVAGNEKRLLGNPRGKEVSSGVDFDRFLV